MIPKIFSDKKMFMVDQAWNRRNDRSLSEDGFEVLHISRTKHLVSVMALGVVASDKNKMPIVFLKRDSKLQVTSTSTSWKQL